MNMKFQRATIHGFGKWTEASFDFSAQPLTVFAGDNETGKSTLQQFLLYMLFGLPPRKRKAWQPKSRSEIGGTLTVQSDDVGIVTIRRTEDACDCLLTNGKVETEAWWQNQLDGLTREVYNSIYAFSALDLGEIRQMRRSHLSDVLFSVGLTGSSAIYQVEKKLDAKLDALYKKQGKNPEINMQINQTTVAYEALEQEKKKEADYQPLMDEREQLTMDLQKKEEALVEKRKKLLTVEQIIQLQPILLRLDHDEKELQKLSEHIPFPEYGFERLQEYRQEMMPLESALTYLQEATETIELGKQKQHARLATEEELQQAKNILAGKALYEQREEQRKADDIIADNVHSKYKELLQDLEWETDQTQALSLPFHLETSWGELQREQRETSKEKQTLNDEHILLEKQADRIQEDIETVSKNMLPEKERQQLEQTLHEDRFQTQEPKNRSGTWKNWQQKREQLSKAIFMGAGALAGIAFLLAWFQSVSLLYLLSVSILLMGIVQYVFMRKSLQMFEQLKENTTKGRQALSPEKRAILLMQKQEEEARKIELDQLHREQQETNNQMEQWTEKYQLCEARIKTLRTKIEHERRDYPFLEQLEVAHWLELLRRIRLLKELHQKLEGLRIANEERRIKQGTMRNQLTSFAYGDTFSEVQQFKDEQMKIRHHYDQLSDDLELKKQEYHEKQTELKPYQEKVQAMFAVAKVSNEEEFFARGHQLEHQQKLSDAVAEARAQIRTSLPVDKAEELFKASVNLMDLEEQRNRLLTEQKETEDQISSQNQALHEIKFELKRLEAAEDPSTLAYRFQMEKDTLQELAGQYAVINMAKTALQMAKQSYQEKYMSSVIEWTTSYFQQLTDGAYTKVFAPGEGTPFLVEGKGDIRYTVEELSQGTIDQLYTALRFAIVKTMSEHMRMPMLIDDAFVHFDDERAIEAMDIMKELASDGQIIFFTFRETLVDELSFIPMKTLGVLAE